MTEIITQLPILQRVKKLCKWLIFKGYAENESELAILLNYTKSSFSQFLNNKKPLTANFIDKITAIDDNVNKVYIQTGIGEMFNESNSNKKDVGFKRNLIPLYNDVATIGGANGLSASVDLVSYTTEYIDAGDWFPGATAAIRHYGDSMVEYPSGSILALKKVEDVRLLVWGRNYCVETTEYRVTKRLNKSKNGEYLTGYSTNKEVYPDGCLVHEPIDIPTDSIRSIYQVLGCVTKEYSSGVVEIAQKHN